jgi:nitroimidazol reductase NimA-like FMN-containing flavoprotein (pyridoxamine 5'-phosphate oxidase superfamily)
MVDTTYDITKSDMVAFLKEKFVMELATCIDGKPAVAPMVYVTDENLNFYFVTYRDTLKSTNLIANPHCSFVVWL